MPRFRHARMDPPESVQIHVGYATSSKRNNLDRRHKITLDRLPRHCSRMTNTAFTRKHESKRVETNPVIVCTSVAAREVRCQQSIQRMREKSHILYYAVPAAARLACSACTFRAIGANHSALVAVERHEFLRQTKIRGQRSSIVEAQQEILRPLLLLPPAHKDGRKCI